MFSVVVDGEGKASVRGYDMRKGSPPKGRQFSCYDSIDPRETDPQTVDRDRPTDRLTTDGWFELIT